MTTHPERTDIHKFLSGLKGQEVLYCPNPGNAGDSAIALATYEVFRKVGLSYGILTWDDPSPEKREVVIYGGGGNLVGYSQARTFIERHLAHSGRMIILPHTIRGNEDLLSRLRPGDDVFCRELRSFEWVRSVTTVPTVHLADDMAFELDVNSIREAESFGGAYALRQALRCLYISAAARLGKDKSAKIRTYPLRKAADRLFHLTRALSKRPYTLNAMRTDREARPVGLPDANLDLSLVFNYGVDSPEIARRATRSVLSVLDSVDSVATDRLHIAILAGLLGKEVDFYANNYFKNEAIYEYSIRDRFPSVVWRGSQAAEHNP